MNYLQNKKNKELAKILSKLLAVIMILLASFLVNNNFRIVTLDKLEKKLTSKTRGTVNGIYYQVEEMTNDCHTILDNNKDYNKKGYYVEDNNYIISLGEGDCGSGLSELYAKNIDYKNKTVEIEIKELNNVDDCSLWSICPKISIKFDKHPDKVLIRDTNNNHFNRIK